LPGDGAFGCDDGGARASAGSTKRAARSTIARRKPFLGICVGMQVLYERSDEFGEHRGLGVSRHGCALRARAARPAHGMEPARPLRSHPFVRGLGRSAYAYFLHSYRARSTPKRWRREHGERFAAIVARDNVMATQFHPEKSQRTGALLLDNFIALARS
jgi:glutamine amidotransferase